MQFPFYQIISSSISDFVARFHYNVLNHGYEMPEEQGFLRHSVVVLLLVDIKGASTKVRMVNFCGL